MLSYEEDHKFFEEVIGYYDIKRLFRMAISAQEPVHILPVGLTKCQQQTLSLLGVLAAK